MRTPHAILLLGAVLLWFAGQVHAANGGVAGPVSRTAVLTQGK